MDNAFWSLLLNAIQTLAIVCSFIAVIWQLKQFNQSIQHDAYSKLADFSTQYIELILDKSCLSNLFYQNNADFTNLDETHKSFYNYIVLILSFYERLYLLLKLRGIDKKTWEAWERWLRDAILPLDLFETVWKNERITYHEDFYHYIDSTYESWKKKNQKMQEIKRVQSEISRSDG